MIFNSGGFLGGKLSPFAACERFVKREVSKADSLQIGDLVADCLEHSFDLMEFPLGHTDLAGTIGGEMDGRGARGGFFPDVHALAKKLNVRVGQRAFTFEAVGLFHVAFGRE